MSWACSNDRRAIVRRARNRQVIFESRRNPRIARGVRQTRNMTYEKSAAAKIFFPRFPLEIGRFQKVLRAWVRQTRTRSGTYGGVFFDK